VERYSGTQFDPDVARVFLEMPDTIWEDLRREINSQIYKFTDSVINKPMELQPK